MPADLALASDKQGKTDAESEFPIESAEVSKKEPVSRQQELLGDLAVPLVESIKEKLPFLLRVHQVILSHSYVVRGGFFELIFSQLIFAFFSSTL